MTQQIRSLVCLTAGALCALAASPAPTLAQAGAFGWSPDTARLTDEDNHQLWENTVALNHAAGVAVGASRSWHNAGSGNAGKVTVTKVYQANGMTCHALQYALSFAGEPVPQNYEFNWCRTPKGQWKIAS